MSDKRKPTLVLDFDGVLHSYASGWKGARVIPDPPVPGALDALVRYLGDFRVAIVSSRSHQWGGRRAMRLWLRKWLGVWDHDTLHRDKPEWVQALCAQSVWDGMDPNEYVALGIVRRIEFPRHKPPALLTIDDRAHQFDGAWPTVQQIAEFKPWNAKG